MHVEHCFCQRGNAERLGAVGDANRNSACGGGRAGLRPMAQVLATTIGVPGKMPAPKGNRWLG
jgi:hypothetical protein